MDHRLLMREYQEMPLWRKWLFWRFALDSRFPFLLADWIEKDIENVSIQDFIKELERDYESLIIYSLGNFIGKPDIGGKDD